MWLVLNGGASVGTARWMAGLSLIFVLLAYNAMAQVYTKRRT